MAEYQDIFARVQVRGPRYAGVPLPGGMYTREGTSRFVYWFG